MRGRPLATLTHLRSTPGRIAAALILLRQHDLRRRRCPGHGSLPGSKELRRCSIRPFHSNPPRCLGNHTTTVRSSTCDNHRRRGDRRRIRPVNRPRLLGVALPTDAHDIHRILRHPLLCSKLAAGGNVLGAVRLVVAYQTTIRHRGGIAWIAATWGGDLIVTSSLVHVKGVGCPDGSIEVRLCRKSEKLCVHPLCCRGSFPLPCSDSLQRCATQRLSLLHISRHIASSLSSSACILYGRCRRSCLSTPILISIRTAQ
jgi:hypothetical protein